MTVERTVRCLMAACALSLVASWLGKAPMADAASPQCAPTVTLPTPSSPVPPSGPASAPTSPSPDNPCWTDVTPYPFGSDGNAVNPTSVFCIGSANSTIGQFGPTWGGDFNGQGNGQNGTPPCYEQVTSMAFRAWNRGLAATEYAQVSQGTSTPPPPNPFGVWLYNGTTWFPDPTFPGAGVCPGDTVMWAGKLDYWLIGSQSDQTLTLCRFDGVNLFWQPMTVPAQTLARLPPNPQGKPTGSITAGTCFAWNNCWFFGTDGIEVHWDGQQLTDETPGLGNSPWLQGDFTAAASTTTPGGAQFGLATNSGQMTVANGLTPAQSGTCFTVSSCPVPNAPDGSPAPRAYGSAGGLWAPLAFAPPDALPPPPDPLNPTFPIPADAVGVKAMSMDSAGDAWAAADPVFPIQTKVEPAPLIPLTANGTEPNCPGYAADTFTLGPGGIGFGWGSLSAMPDGSSVFAGGTDSVSTTQFQAEDGSQTDSEPVIVQGACGSAATITEFRVPDPFDANQSTAPTVPADESASGLAGTGSITAVSASATNDVWAAAGAGQWQHPDPANAGSAIGGPQRPHLYQFTDGQPPDAPAGDDNEPRPSLFTLSPPVFQVVSPTVTVAPSVTKTRTLKGKTKKVQLKPAIYGVRTRLQHGGTRKTPTYTLRLTFKLRRPVTVGLQALHGSTVVARAPMRRFTGRTGELSLRLNRKRWPTRLKLTTPKGQQGEGSSTPQPTSQK